MSTLSRSQEGSSDTGYTGRVRWSFQGLCETGRRFLALLLSTRLPPSIRREVAIAGLAVVIMAGTHLHVGLRTGFIPCTLDCGETYEAHIAALNLYRFGLAYAGGLEDFAASPRAAAHPTLYTHNPNLGMYFLYALFLAGLGDVHTQAALIGLPFAVGLLYLYLFVRGISQDGTMAALILLNAATLYLLVDLWGFHALRGFSWILTFGIAFHLHRFSSQSRRPWFHLAVAAVYMAVAFGIDYPFALFSAVMVLALGAVGIVRIRVRSLLGIVTVAFGVPFVLRQLQVASAIGPALWWTDFTYSILRRIPIARIFGTVPDEATLRAFYSAHHIINWPGDGRFAPLTWLGRVARAYWTVVGPPLALLALGWVVAVVALVRSGGRRAVKDAEGPVAAVLSASLAIAASLVVTFAVFGEYFASFYGVVLGPLVVHWIVLVLGLTTYVLLAHVRATLRIGARVVPVGAILLGLFVLWRAGTEVRNYLTFPPRGYPGREALEELRGHSVLTLWISSAPSAYTGEWAAVLTDARWLALGPRQLEFDPQRDYYFFMEADRTNPRYRRPEFLLVPGLNIPALYERKCRALHGIASFADGCADLDVVARRLAWLPLYRRGSDYLIYDLRGQYARQPASLTEPARSFSSPPTS